MRAVTDGQVYEIPDEIIVAVMVGEGGTLSLQVSDSGRVLVDGRPLEVPKYFTLFAFPDVPWDEVEHGELRRRLGARSTIDPALTPDLSELSAEDLADVEELLATHRSRP